MEKIKDSTKDRELKFSRLLNARIELVWEIWTDPEHIKLWWGPDGFTNTIKKMDMKPGGEWLLIMRGPDGTDYDIKAVFKEVVRYKKIEYEKFTNFKCIATIEFEARGEKTYLEWRMLFESREYLAQVAKAYGVDPGLTQTAERLINYLLQLTTK